MYIYLLINKANDKKYVGQTIKEPDFRFSQHRLGSYSEKRRKKQPITAAIHKYGWGGFSRHVLEVCHSQEELNDAERYWISRYNCMAPTGYNLDTGGRAGGKKSDETRRRMSMASKGRIVSEETRLKISTANSGRVHSDESRANMSRSKCGLKHSEETKTKIANALAGIPQGPMSDETRAKMSASHSGVRRGPMSDDQRKKLSDANLGKLPAPASEETRARMAEARRLWWAKRKKDLIDAPTES